MIIPAVFCLVSTECSDIAVKRQYHYLFAYILIYREIVLQSREIFNRHIKLQAAKYYVSHRDEILQG